MAGGFWDAVVPFEFYWKCELRLSTLVCLVAFFVFLVGFWLGRVTKGLCVRRRVRQGDIIYITRANLNQAVCRLGDTSITKFHYWKDCRALVPRSDPDHSIRSFELCHFCREGTAVKGSKTN